jgi:hypothetical protein
MIGLVVLPATVEFGSEIWIWNVSLLGSMSCTVTVKLNGPLDAPLPMLSLPVPVKTALLPVTVRVSRLLPVKVKPLVLL